MRIAAFRLCWQALQMVQPLRCKWLCWMRMLSVHSFRQLQVLVKEMIDAWGPSGLEQHARTMQQAYAHRAQVVLGAAGAPMIPVGPAARSLHWDSTRIATSSALHSACAVGMH